MSKKGFTLIELMIVVSIVSFLAMVSVPSFMKFLAKAKRSEAYMNLSALYTAEKMHFAEHGSYSSVLSGSGGIGWKPEGYHGGGKDENFYYTYGFANGAEGANYFTGKLQTPSSHLSQAHVNKDSFMIIAAGDICNNGKPDIIAVDQYNSITILQDGLAD